ncbi:MAG: hypothetical protein FD152_4011 [Xanthobacteraceae bacterium]|nr:MAG: hypothetical protein FD152_4011 [Xanthobacteraceae bacterium]
MSRSRKSRLPGIPHGARVHKFRGAILGHFEPPADASRRASIDDLRIAEVQRLIPSRHPAGWCDTDDGEAYARVAFPHIIARQARKLRGIAPTSGRTSPEEFARTWAASLTPLLDAETVDRLINEAMVARRLNADAAAAVLGVTLKERETLRFRTIGACDVSRRERMAIAAEKKKARDRQRAAAKRRAAGSASRADYERNSATAEAGRLGISRWALRRKRLREAKQNPAAPITAEHNCVANGEGEPSIRDAHVRPFSSEISGEQPRAHPH